MRSIYRSAHAASSCPKGLNCREPERSRLQHCETSDRSEAATSSPRAQTHTCLAQRRSPQKTGPNWDMTSCGPSGCRQTQQRGLQGRAFQRRLPVRSASKLRVKELRNRGRMEQEVKVKGTRQHGCLYSPLKRTRIDVCQMVVASSKM